MQGFVISDGQRVPLIYTGEPIPNLVDHVASVISVDSPIYLVHEDNGEGLAELELLVKGSTHRFKIRVNDLYRYFTLRER